VDADPQGSALDWASMREEVTFPAIGLPKATLHREIAKLANGYAHVVIVGPPRINEIAKSILVASDLVLIPVQPSPYDVWACKDVVQLVEEARAFKEMLKAVFVINRKIPNTAIGRDVREALERYGIPILKAEVCQRVAFAESAAAGRVADSGKAAEEINALVEEISSQNV
jgi:chromosome partitioning protein